MYHQHSIEEKPTLVKHSVTFYGELKWNKHNKRDSIYCRTEKFFEVHCYISIINICFLKKTIVLFRLNSNSISRINVEIVYFYKPHICWNSRGFFTFYCCILYWERTAVQVYDKVQTTWRWVEKDHVLVKIHGSVSTHTFWNFLNVLQQRCDFFLSAKTEANVGFQQRSAAWQLSCLWQPPSPPPPNEKVPSYTCNMNSVTLICAVETLM